MFQMTMSDIAWMLNFNDNFLILTHRRPDGDTLGSAAALCRGLRQIGKTAYLLENEEITPKYAPLVDGLEAPPGFKPAFRIAVDIADEELLPKSALPYAGIIDMCIDHHPSNKGYAGHVLLVPTAAATGEIIFSLFEEMKIPMNIQILDPLYVAVATDTGCFMFSNTTALSHNIAARCIEAGVDFHAHNRECFQKKTKARFLVEQYIMDNLQFYADDKLGIVCLTRRFIDSVHAQEDDTDNLSTLLMQLDGILCGIVLTESREDGSYKASVRTHKPVDASAICQNFGGGGHPRAAGCTLNFEQSVCIAKLAQIAQDALKSC